MPERGRNVYAIMGVCWGVVVNAGGAWGSYAASLSGFPFSGAATSRASNVVRNNGMSRGFLLSNT